jgi:hypothetical protein
MGEGPVAMLLPVIETVSFTLVGKTSNIILPFQSTERY